MEKYIFSAEKRAALESLRQPFAVYQFINKRVVTLLLSDGFCDLFGYADRAEAVFDMDHNMYKDTHPDDVARIANAAVCFATEGGSYEVIYRTKKKNTGEYVVVHAMGEHVYTDDGVRLAQIWYTDEGTYADSALVSGPEVTRALISKIHEQSLMKASHYDFLTGLPNMTYFFELAETGKNGIMSHGGRPMLLYIDFSGMKFFNNREGFSVGDQMLQSFARILVHAFGTEYCCRIGADHFAVIAEAAGLEDTLSRIFREFGMLYDGKTPPVHVGIYPYTIDGISVSTACDLAKMACNVLKGSYASCFRYYSAELHEDTELKQYIIENFETAVRERWIKVYFQPIIRAVNERVCDTEALARWDDPERGLLSPASFIPVLEEAGLIHKLDLYVLDRVLEMIQLQKKNGFFVISHSINLSRSDFDACDIVEEIRRRVDAAGVEHDRLNIEITESVICRDAEFMREQVERFQKLGFPVWMDDFGSGYSSMDVLQSIRFDLIKFDMTFMRKLDEGENGKIILTDLMRLATSLGVDTVCEGVETESQVRFLQEVGCSKLQGYYYSKPVSFETILERYRNHTLIESENPAESDYFESIGRVNLFDLGVIASEDGNTLQNTFNTIPIAILEIKDDSARYIRSNHSYLDFAKRFFHLDNLQNPVDLGEYSGEYGAVFVSVVKQCCQNGSRMFFDETVPGGQVVHFFARRICVNPVTDSAAVVIAVISVTEPDESTTYADIARSLAADYYNICVIDLDTNQYIEYSSRIGGEELSIERHGEDFFESARRDTKTRIYEEDRESFLKWFTKENVLRELDTQGVFTTTYRLADTGTPVYVNMKVTRMKDGRRLIIGISNIDAQMKQLEEEKKLRRERISLGRIAALSPNYIVLYVVDPVTGHYTQYSPSREFKRFGLAECGENFFSDVVKDAPKAIDPEDLERHLHVFTQANVMREIQRNGFFLHNYRLLMNGGAVPVSLRATLAPEGDGDKILIGVVKDEKEKYRRVLEEAYEKARNSSIMYTHIAHALARGYTDLFYVNMDSGEYIEFHTGDEFGVLTQARKGSDFFESCERDAKLFVYREDQEKFLQAMDRGFLRDVLARSSVFEMSYRRIKEERIFYVQMKVSRVEEDPRFIVLAVSDIDELMRQRREEEKIQEERVIYARLHALTGNFICVYVVDPETDSYREFSTADHYEEYLSEEKEGTDFFTIVRDRARLYNHPDDLDLFLSAFTKENILAQIERGGIYTLGYRLISKGRPVHVQMKAAMVEEKEGPRLIVGLNDIDVQVRQEEELGRLLAQAQSQASIDALTGIKNRNAYLDAEARINRQMADQNQPPFAVVVLDVNDLKKVNDTAGHQAGDQCLRDACKIICDTFKHSPVFRVGGDEFAVISQGTDYEHIEELLDRMQDYNLQAMRSGKVVVACGMARSGDDPCVACVFKRADKNMYENKKALKMKQPASACPQ